MDAKILTPLAQRLQVSPTLRINELVRQHQSAGHHIVHLGFGEATFPIQKDVLQLHQDSSRAAGYLPVAGLLGLRESIARFQSRRLGEEVSATQVVVSPGSKPVLFALFDVLSGDVLLPRPSWVSYEPQIIHAGRKLFWVETDEWDRHTITGSALEAAYVAAIDQGANPRIMLINSPSNPTGQVFSQQSLETISTFCQNHSIILISDEIYGDLCFNDAEQSEKSQHVFTMTPKVSRSVIVTSGMSKTYSAGGWRIGYAIFPDNVFGQQVQAAILAYASECWSAASSPAQTAAALAFEPSTAMDQYRINVTRLHSMCTRRLYQVVKECGLDVPEPKGAFYLYPSFGAYAEQLRQMGIKNSLELAEWLIEDCGIATLPGSAFGEDDDSGLPGGRYRLRLATSNLFFHDEQDRYARGYNFLEAGYDESQHIQLPLLDEAVTALRAAIERLKAVDLHTRSNSI